MAKYLADSQGERSGNDSVPVVEVEGGGELLREVELRDAVTNVESMSCMN